MASEIGKAVFALTAIGVILGSTQLMLSSLDKFINKETELLRGEISTGGAGFEKKSRALETQYRNETASAIEPIISLLEDVDDFLNKTNETRVKNLTAELRNRTGEFRK